MKMRKLLNILPDRLYIDLQFYRSFKRFPNWKNPITFCEKIQWLKLNYKNPLLSSLVDKYAVKRYVADKIGEKYIIPTLGVWTSTDEITWDELPQRFVLKTTHGGGNNGVVVVDNKYSIDQCAITDKLSKAIHNNSYYYGREWPYKYVKKQIIAEVNINDGTLTDIPDFKFYCFNGKPTYCQVINGRSTKETIDFFDMEWNHQPFVGLSIRAQNSMTSIDKPVCFEEMVKVANELSEGFPFVRVDLYVANNQVYFGELTFYPGSGIGLFRPSEWDIKLGNLLDLPTL